MLNEKYQALLDQYDISVSHTRRGRGCVLCFGENDVYALSQTSLSEENTEKDTTEEEKPVATATSEESTKEQTKTTTATKKDEQAKPKSATGTYNGFADTSSVEIEMPDGSYQTFMVNDEDLVNKLNDMDEGTKITFTYGAVEGQANMEILSIE